MTMETADEFFDRRKDWLDVGVVRNSKVSYEHSNYGSMGYDVVLRVDGSYMSKDDADAIADLFRQQLAHLMSSRPVYVKDLTDGN